LNEKGRETEKKLKTEGEGRRVGFYSVQDLGNFLK
jgi:hypothetical protein